MKNRTWLDWHVCRLRCNERKREKSIRHTLFFHICNIGESFSTSKKAILYYPILFLRFLYGSRLKQQHAIHRYTQPCTFKLPARSNSGRSERPKSDERVLRFPKLFSGANKIRKRIFEPEGRGTFPAHDRAYLSPPFFPGSFAMFVYAGKGDHFHPLWLGKMPNFRLTLCVKKYCPLLFCIGKSNLIQGRKYLTYPTTFRLYSSQNCANPNSFPWIFLKKDLSALFMPNQYLGEGSYSTLLYVHVHFFESEGWSEEEGEVCSCL